MTERVHYNEGEEIREAAPSCLYHPGAPSVCRGLCRSCYSKFAQRVQGGKITWRELEETGQVKSAQKRTPWTDQEERTCRLLWGQNLSLRAIARALNRTLASVHARRPRPAAPQPKPPPALPPAGARTVLARRIASSGPTDHAPGLDLLDSDPWFRRDGGRWYLTGIGWAAIRQEAS